MPMYQPGNGAYTSETLAYYSAIQAAGSDIDAATLAAVDEFIRAGKRDGWWTPILDCSLFVGKDLTGALVKLKAATGTAGTVSNHNFVSGDYTQKLGLGVSSNTTKWLGTGVDCSLIGLVASDMSFGLQQLDPNWDAVFVSSGFFMGLNPAAGDTNLQAARAIGLGASTASGSGYTGGRIFEAVSYTGGTGTWSFNGSRGSISSTTVSGALDISTEVTLFRCTRNTVLYYSAGRVGFYFIGQSMTQAQLNAMGVALQEFNRRIGRVPPGEVRATFMGDSITAGEMCTTTPKNRWTTQVANGIGAMEYNCGAPSSLVVSDGSAALSFVNRYPDVLNLKSSTLFVMGGTNDLGADGGANGTQSLADTYTTNLTTITNAFLADGVRVIVVGMPYRASANSTKMTMWNAANAKAARNAGVPFVDIVGAMNDTGTPANLMNADGIHPNDSGHALIAKRAIEAWQGRLVRYTPLTFGAVAANSSVDVTLTMYGVSLGSGAAGTKQTEVTVTPYTGVAAGLSFSAFVSADDTVTIRCTNSTAGAITPTAAAYYNVTAHL